MLTNLKQILNMVMKYHKKIISKNEYPKYEFPKYKYPKYEYLKYEY